jgi:hypothetical protein
MVVVVVIVVVVVAVIVAVVIVAVVVVIVDTPSCPSVFYAWRLAVSILSSAFIMNPPDDRPPSTFAAPTPVVLHIMPKARSSAPIGYVYDPDPSCNGGEGGLLAASAAFFTHQGH